jgi:DNA-binding NarL/FixJ family response regulator
MNILYLEDHNFFGDSINQILKEDYPEHNIFYATTYAQAEEFMRKHSFKISILDVVLQNGKTGIHFVEKYSSSLGGILFVTGCKDESTLKALEKYNHIEKNIEVLNNIKQFINTINAQ